MRTELQKGGNEFAMGQCHEVYGEFQGGKERREECGTYMVMSDGVWRGRWARVWWAWTSCDCLLHSSSVLSLCSAALVSAVRRVATRTSPRRAPQLRRRRRRRRLGASAADERLSITTVPGGYHTSITWVLHIYQPKSARWRLLVVTARAARSVLRPHQTPERRKSRSHLLLSFLSCRLQCSSFLLMFHTKL